VAILKPGRVIVEQRKLGENVISGILINFERWERERTKSEEVGRRGKKLGFVNFPVMTVWFPGRWGAFGVAVEVALFEFSWQTNGEKESASFFVIPQSLRVCEREIEGGEEREREREKERDGFVYVVVFDFGDGGGGQGNERSSDEPWLDYEHRYLRFRQFTPLVISETSREFFFLKFFFCEALSFFWFCGFVKVDFDVDSV
jgi:hypothetical protein